MIVILIVPIITLLIMIGWMQSLLFESYRLQAEWIQVWQQMFLLQSTHVQKLTVIESRSCDHPENILVIQGESHDCWVYECNGTRIVKLF